MVPICYRELPDGVSGFSVYDETEEYLIVININMTLENQKKTLKKEKDKIENGLYVNEVVRSTCREVTLV